MIRKVIAYFKAIENRNAKKRLMALRQEAIEKSISLYNIERIEGIDFITFKGKVVSTKDDSQNLCDRLNAYRISFIDRCIEKGEVE